MLQVNKFCLILNETLSVLFFPVLYIMFILDEHGFQFNYFKDKCIALTMRTLGKVLKESYTWDSALLIDTISTHQNIQGKGQNIKHLSPQRKY